MFQRCLAHCKIDTFPCTPDCNTRRRHNCSTRIANSSCSFGHSAIGMHLRRCTNQDCIHCWDLVRARSGRRYHWRLVPSSRPNTLHTCHCMPCRSNTRPRRIHWRNPPERRTFRCLHLGNPRDHHIDQDCIHCSDPHWPGYSSMNQRYRHWSTIRTFQDRTCYNKRRRCNCH